MMNWNFAREETKNFNVPEGPHRIKIASAKLAKSKAGNDMLALQFDVSGINTRLYHYITFLPNNPSLTNKLLTQFFDSFSDITCGDFDFNNWIGKTGACMVAKEKDDPTRTRLYYFINAIDQSGLDVWQDPPRMSRRSYQSEATAVVYDTEDYDTEERV